MKTKTALVVAALVVLCGSSPVRAGDGYQYEVSELKMVGVTAKNIKPGEVLKIRRFNVDFDQGDDDATGYPHYTAVLFSNKRGFAPDHEIQVDVTTPQKAMLEHASMVFLRRTEKGWTYLGTNVSRDAKGAIIYQY